MKTIQPLIILGLGLNLFLANAGHAADTSLNVPLATPQLQTVQASIPVGAETVEVALTLVYNTRGQLLAADGSTVDGTPATCVGTETKRGTNVNYALTIKASTDPATKVVLRGVLGTGTASATYAGPKGRARIPAQPVAIASVTPVPAQVNLSSAVNARGGISGTGNILAYGTNGATPGKLRGTLKNNKLTWTLAQAPRSASFKGIRSNDVYLGSLKITAPPARETIQPFTVPASAFPVASGVASFRGTILEAGNSLPTASAGVKVTVKSDLNGDGKFLGNETATVTTDAQGRYQASLGVTLDRPVLLEMSKTGFAKYMNAYPNVTPGSAVMKNHTLQPLTALNVSGGTAQSSDGRITLTGLPGNISNVEARVFNPVTETAQFPGQFADDQDNLLVSSVFSAIEARNASGAAVTNLGANTTLCMEIPRDTWNTMGDLAPGNGQIDIPLYFYDEATGQWKRNAADGWLEDTNRARIPEAQLASIRNGSYSGRVFGAGPITHLSYWNVDWPIETHTAIRGLIAGTNSEPVEGASVTIKGVTFTGSTSPQLTPADGTFCADTMRSENPGEDVDRDDVPGETQQVNVFVQHGTNFYSFGPFNTPVEQGTCASGGGLDVGTLVLSDANRLVPTSCTITGRMVYSGTALNGTSPLNPGDPIVGATVFGFDSGVPELLAECLFSGNCGAGMTDANGYFTFNTIVLSEVTVFASKVESIGSFGFDYYNSFTTIAGCPPGLVTLSADFTSLRYLVLELAGANVENGTFTLINDQPVASFMFDSVLYLGTSPNPQPRPTELGPWVTLNLLDLNTSSSAGTMTFTVTSLEPLAGTWTTSTLGASGTFAEQTF